MILESLFRSYEMLNLGYAKLFDFPNVILQITKFLLIL
jgi:hypothetical protein